MDTYPIFKVSHLEYKEDEQFKRNLNFFKNVVNIVQDSNNQNVGETYMSFYPIAKNVRFLATYMAHNIMQNKTSVISNNPRMGEGDFWKDRYNEPWQPWFWARSMIEGDFSNEEGWNYYFDSFSSKSKKFTVVGDSESPSPEKTTFFLMLACILYVHQLAEAHMTQINEYKQQMNWPSTKILSVQIRRGEIYNKEGTEIFDRPFISIEKYAEKIDLILNANPDFTHVYVSTDSEEEISNLQNIRPHWKILSLPIDRTKFFRLEGQPRDLEVFVRADMSSMAFITGTAIADIYFMGQCQAFVGTMANSAFSRLGFFLQMAIQEKVTPYYDMVEKESDCRLPEMLFLI
jgi:hypothetical protein